MPCNYKNYPDNWKTEIRPAILNRAKNKCEQCGVKNRAFILRGEWRGRNVYQDSEGWIYDAATSAKVGGDCLGEVDKTGRGKMIKIILTVAHLDHNTKNNKKSNLKALCQKCHLAHDAALHAENARRTRNKKKGLASLFEE